MCHSIGFFWCQQPKERNALWGVAPRQVLSHSSTTFSFHTGVQDPNTQLVPSFADERHSGFTPTAWCGKIGRTMPCLDGFQWAAAPLSCFLRPIVVVSSMFPHLLCCERRPAVECVPSTLGFSWSFHLVGRTNAPSLGFP